MGTEARRGAHGEGGRSARKHCDAFSGAEMQVAALQHPILMRSERPVALLLQEVFSNRGSPRADSQNGISFNWP